MIVSGVGAQGDPCTATLRRWLE